MSIVAPGDNRVPQFNPWTSISFQERAAPLAVLGLVGLSFAPLLVEHLWNLSSFEHHKHFPLVIGGVLFLIWKRWPRSYAGLASLTIDEHDLVEVQSAVPWPRWVSLLWTVVLWSCLGGLLIAILLHSPWSATVFAIGVLTACVFVFAGSQVVLPYDCVIPVTEIVDKPQAIRPREVVCNSLRALLPPCSLLLLLLPLPFGWDDRFVQRMQRLTSDLASRILDLLEVKHLMAGNTLELIGQTLFVDRACSGANGLLAMIAFSMFLVVLLRMSWLVVVPQLVLTTAWVVLMNAMRIVVITIALVKYGIDLSQGWQHDAFSYAILPLTVLFAYGTLVWLHWLTSPISFPHVWPAVVFNTLLHFKWSGLVQFVKPSIRFSGDESPPIGPATGSKSRAIRQAVDATSNLENGESSTATQERTRALYLPFGVARGIGTFVLAIAAIALQIGLAVRGSPPVSVQEANFEQLAEDSMPADFNGWTRSGFEVVQRQPSDERGKKSKAWMYRTSGVPNWPVVVSLDYPFMGWHELGQCYRAIGWQETGRNVVENSEGQPFTSFISFRKPTGEHGSLWFALVDAYGNRVAPVESTGGIRKRLQGSMIRYGLVPTTFQIQVFIQSEIQLQPKDMNHGARQLEDAIRVLVKSQQTSTIP